MDGPAPWLIRWFTSIFYCFLSRCLAPVSSVQMAQTPTHFKSLLFLYHSLTATSWQVILTFLNLGFFICSKRAKPCTRRIRNKGLAFCTFAEQIWMRGKWLLLYYHLFFVVWLKSHLFWEAFQNPRCPKWAIPLTPPIEVLGFLKSFWDLVYVL